MTKKQKHQVVVDELLATYYVCGTGSKTILCLHGWGDSAATFDHIASHTDFRYICVDLPGFGGTSAPTKPWGLDEFSIWVGAFVRKLDLQLDGLIGHSNGGAIAIRALSLGVLHPEKLILLAASGIRRPQSFRNQALKLVAKSGRALTLALPKTARHRIRRKLYQQIGSDYLVAEHMRETFVKVVAQDVLGDAAKVSVPTLLIYGAEDHATPPIFGALFAERMPKASCVIIPDAGHHVHIDQPEDVSKLIADFLT